MGAVRTSRLHQFTAKLAKSHGVVVVQDIATANLIRGHHLAQAIGNQGWAELARQLRYKTTRAGATLVVPGRWLPSSKTCSACGAVKPTLPLGVRCYRCDVCALVIDRDQRRRKPRRLGGPSAQLAEHACAGSNEPASTAAGALVGKQEPAGRAPAWHKHRTVPDRDNFQTWQVPAISHIS